MQVQPAPIHRLDIGEAFYSLDEDQKRYAHHLARAAWHGARIIMRQVSPESEQIYDWIIELHKACSGTWSQYVENNLLTSQELEKFLEYAATFLSNVGNYYGSGDQKFIPSVSAATLARLSSITSESYSIFSRVERDISSVPPFNLGLNSDIAQSAYYLGQRLSQQEAESIQAQLERHSIHPENTRIHKNTRVGTTCYKVLQASLCHHTTEIAHLENVSGGARIELVGGDFSDNIAAICAEMRSAMAYTANELQHEILSNYVESLETGNLHIYRKSQELWVKDKEPRVENIFGFVEPYRDPCGTRAEWEGLVAISDVAETDLLRKLVERSSEFIKRLPWVCESEENSGKGPFEKELFEAPDLSSINVLAYCSSIIFPGINLPNYNDIRQTCGFKNVIVANRMTAESSNTAFSPFVSPTEAATFQKHKFAAYYPWVVLHELLGHGTGKLLCEETLGQYNFNKDKAPINPLTSEPITSWYLPGQSWTGQFQDLATTVDECRAELVGAYLMDDTELLAIFGHTENSEITAQDVTYNLYLQLGVDGLRGLQNFNVEDNTWGQAHSRAHFATLKWLLASGKGFMEVAVDQKASSIQVHLDFSKLSHGKSALGQMLLRLHIFRCIADVSSCREFYEDLSRVDGDYLLWRELVMKQVEPKFKFVQANTFSGPDECIVLKEYESTNSGIIQSWAERSC